MRINETFELNKLQSKRIDVWLMLSLSLGLILAVLSLYTGYIIAPAGRDFSNYESFYNSLSTSYGGVDSGERFEPGFKFLSYLITLLFPQNSKLYFSIIIFISLITKYILVFQYSKGDAKRCLLFFAFYIPSFFLVFEVNQIREAIAIGFGFLSFLYFYNNKIWITLILFLLAFSFHYTSVIYLIGYFSIYYFKKDRKWLVFLLITTFTLLSKFAIVLFESINPIAEEYKLNYDDVTFGLTNITFLLALFFFLFHFYFIKREAQFNSALLLFLYFGISFFLVISDIPVYQIRILELTEVACLFIGINRKFTSYHDYGSFLLLAAIILHKFVAFVVVNPLFG
jgi:hypothetical protein